MSEDSRCCGTGTCIINSEGECWCGQRWDGEKMCFPKPLSQRLNPSNESQGDILQAMNKPD
jgi:hypothetical protein